MASLPDREAGLFLWLRPDACAQPLGRSDLFERLSDQGTLSHASETILRRLRPVPRSNAHHAEEPPHGQLRLMFRTAQAA